MKNHPEILLKSSTKQSVTKISGKKEKEKENVTIFDCYYIPSHPSADRSSI
jgi:hypothetical protein